MNNDTVSAIGDDFFAARTRRFSPSPSQLAAVRVRELIAAGHDIIKLTTGEPDFATPEPALAAAAEAMRGAPVGYTPINGTLALRKAIQHKFRRDNNLDYGLDQIAVGSGTKQVIFNALMATVAADDEVIISAPYWTSYPDMVKLAGGKPVIISCEQQAGFKLRPEQLRRALNERSKWLLFNSPGNPSGVVYSVAEIAALAEVVLEHPRLHILCDDVYEHLVFDGHEFVTFAQVEPRLYPRVLTCNGVSKAYSMTGWRVGFGAGRKELITNISKMQSQSTAGVSAVSQAAAVAALNAPLDLIHERTADLQRRRDLLFNALSEIDGLHCQRPPGAMYIYCSCADFMGATAADSRRIDNDTDFTDYLLDVAGVAVVQGAAYGMSPYFRASFVAADNELIRGAERIAQACQALH